MTKNNKDIASVLLKKVAMAIRKVAENKGHHVKTAEERTEGLYVDMNKMRALLNDPERTGL